MDRLLELLRTHSYRKKKVVLASGKESDFFVDCKQTALRAEGHALVGEAMLDALSRLPTKADAVAGVALGGCPLASAVSLVSHQKGTPLDAVYVRKEVKDHGSRRQIEGDDHLADGAAIAVLEDVVTTGGSTLKALGWLRDAGYTIAGVVALVDRREGGAENLRDAGVPFVALYGREDFTDEG
ncbi:MAG: orotate phosphoribosyltransferase [Myxococcota bacterium]|nr:orotate phosphoribosyltransferase [Myxococcota bacterium]